MVNEEIKNKILKDLVNVLEAYQGSIEIIANQGQAMDGYSALHNFISIAERAKECINE